MTIMIDTCLVNDNLAWT